MFLTEQWLHSGNLSIWEAETKTSGVQGQPWLHIEPAAIPGPHSLPLLNYKALCEGLRIRPSLCASQTEIALLGEKLLLFEM